MLLRAQRFLFRDLGCPRNGLRLHQRRLAIQCCWVEAAAWLVIPIEELGRPVRESDFEAAAVRDSLVLDDADAVWHVPNSAKNHAQREWAISGRLAVARSGVCRWSVVRRAALQCAEIVRSPSYNIPQAAQLSSLHRQAWEDMMCKPRDVTDSDLKGALRKPSAKLVSAMSTVTSRDQPSAVLKATIRTPSSRLPELEPSLGELRCINRLTRRGSASPVVCVTYHRWCRLEAAVIRIWCWRT